MTNPSRKTNVCLALPGAGTLLGVIAGALEVLEDDGELEFVAVGGTSGGGLVALGLALGMTPSDITLALSTLLQRRDLLDKGWPFDQNPGLYRGARIEGFLQEFAGKHTRMGDLKLPARVCAWDSWIREPVVIDSEAHKDVFVWRAARATMAIEFFFDLIRIREDNARLYGDGGLVVNVPHGLWDDRPEPTLGFRFSDQLPAFDIGKLIANGGGNTSTERVEPVRTWAQLVPAVAKTALSTASASWPSRKAAVGGAGFQELVLDTDANGMQFGLTPSEIARRRQQGRLSAKRAQLAFGGGVGGGVGGVGGVR
jgi:predicted acylesterase/phospholipase RssA